MAISTDPTAGDALYPREASHPNPMFDFLTGFIPRRLKDLFRWAEYLAYSSAHIYAVIKKFGEYPITRFVYKTESEDVKEQHKDLFERRLRVKGFLTKVSFDKFLYGNSFVSVYEPFKRYLKCPICKTKHDIKVIDYKYDHEKVMFRYTCPVKTCRANVAVRPIDEKLKEVTKVGLIRWDPKLIDIDHNPITGESEYYYTIPEWMKDAVKKGSKNLINTMPFDFLDAMRRNKTFKFGEGQLYHMKVPGPAGVESHWGFPPITSAIKLFLFAATLRKANEAIALEHITPMRVLYPQTGSAVGDPLSTINLSEWKYQVEQNYRKFRRDPLHVMISPTPIGVEDIGGQGRAMLTLGEVQEAEKNIILSMGVPMEFVTGGLGQTRGEITLRMIENQLQTHVEDLNELVQWIEDKVAKFLSYKVIRVHLSDFKMIDDMDNKQMVFALWQAGKASDTRMMEALNLDPKTERKQILEDRLADARMQQDLQVEMNKLQSSLSNVAQQKAQASQGGQMYDVSQVLAMASQKADEYIQLDPNTRKSRMDALQGEDPVMYAVVRDRLEQAQQNQQANAKAQQGQGQPQ